MNTKLHCTGLIQCLVAFSESSLDPSQLPSTLVPQHSLHGCLTISGPVAEIRLPLSQQKVSWQAVWFLSIGGGQNHRQER